MSERYARLRDDDRRYVWHPFTQTSEWLAQEPLIVERADGFFLVDVDGNRFLDGVSSIWCNVHGHGHPKIVAAMKEQLDRVTHSTMLGLSHAPAIELARRLVEITPAPLTRVFFSDSGSTAVEVALRMAFQYQRQCGQRGRTRFVTMTDAYHGDTIGSVSLGFSEPFHTGYEKITFKVSKFDPPFLCEPLSGLGPPELRGGETSARSLANAPGTGPDEYAQSCDRGESARDTSGRAGRGGDGQARDLEHSDDRGGTGANEGDRDAQASGAHAASGARTASEVRTPGGVRPASGARPASELCPAGSATGGGDASAWGAALEAASACSLEQLEDLLAREGETVAAVFIEPLVQGAAGIWPQPPSFVRGVRELCDRYGALLVCDEVATGFGRTGSMFAVEQAGVSPDILCLAKGLSAGYLPLAATVASEEIFDAFSGSYSDYKTLFHGHTYGGNPLGCAAALANLDVFAEEDTVGAAAAGGKLLGELLAEQIAPLPNVGPLRRVGMMVGFDLLADPASGVHFPVDERRSNRAVLAAREEGVIIRPLGDTMVLMPPLNMPAELLERVVATTARAIAAATADARELGR